jgi:hypothetical protein
LKNTKNPKKNENLTLKYFESQSIQYKMDDDHVLLTDVLPIVYKCDDVYNKVCFVKNLQCTFSDVSDALDCHLYVPYSYNFGYDHIIC